jgi:hypothetical protein
MAKITPKDYAKEYKEQESLTAGYQTPPDGTYEVVNVSMNRLKIRTKTGRVMNMLNITAHVLKCIEAHDKDGAVDGKEFEGKNASFSLFAEWQREDGTPDRRSMALMSCLGAACGQTEEWDPDNDGDLIRATTGVPYLLKFETRERKTDSGEVRKDINVREFKHLSGESKKRHMSAPDWKKLVGEPSSRMKELKDFSQPKDGEHKAGKKDVVRKMESGAPQHEDDPFEELG